MTPLKEHIAHYILRYGAPFLIKSLGASIRFTLINDGPARSLGARGKSRIFAFWHNRFLMMPYLYKSLRGTKNICVMTSRSRDGQYITDVLDGFDFATARGSSSRGGQAALREMTSLIKKGYDIAITPDGPRGPCYRVQPGIILLAQISGIPIIPATYDVKRKKRLASWDRFIIPHLFTKGVLVFGDPFTVSKKADEEERERKRLELETILKRLNGKAASLLRIPDDGLPAAGGSKGAPEDGERRP
jgi:lysophospholipid acyltransferase (LPLAT)-like uncharacterized protein